MPKKVAEKTDWIKLGFKLFSEQGAKGIVVDVMAKKLRCNRSSFYWHFKSKDIFIEEIFNYWVEQETNQIISEILKENSSEEKFKVLVKITFKADPYIDFIFHLKRYAVKRKDIRNSIDEIDKQRIAFVKTILQEFNYSENEALMKAQIFYKYLIGYHEMIKNKTQSKNYVQEVYSDLKHFIQI